MTEERRKNFSRFLVHVHYLIVFLYVLLEILLLNDFVIHDSLILFLFKIRFFNSLSLGLFGFLLWLLLVKLFFSLFEIFNFRLDCSFRHRDRELKDLTANLYLAILLFISFSSLF